MTKKIKTVKDYIDARTELTDGDLDKLEEEIEYFEGLVPATPTKEYFASLVNTTEKDKKDKKNYHEE